MPEILRLKAKHAILGCPFLMLCSLAAERLPSCRCGRTCVPAGFHHTWAHAQNVHTSFRNVFTLVSYSLCVLTKAYMAFARFISFQNYCPGLFIHKQSIKAN